MMEWTSSACDRLGKSIEQCAPFRNGSSVLFAVAPFGGSGQRVSDPWNGRTPEVLLNPLDRPSLAMAGLVASQAPLFLGKNRGSPR